MADDHLSLTWRASIKRATMTQKFNEKGEVRNILQLLFEGDALGPNDMRGLAMLQKESLVTLTIEPTQMAFSWTIPAEKGNTHAEVSDQSAGSGGDAVSEAADGLGIV